MTGSPVAIASRIVLEMPSPSEGSTKQSRPRRMSGTSLRSPGSHARSAIPASASIARASLYSAPSPTSRSRMRSRFDGASCSAWMKARTRLSGSLTGSIRPTVPTSQNWGSRNGQPSIALLPRPRRPETQPRRRRCRSVRTRAARHADVAHEVALEVARQARCTGVTNGRYSLRTHWYLRLEPCRSSMSRPCSPWMRTGTPAAHAGTTVSSAARLRRVHDGRAHLAEQRMRGVDRACSAWPGRLCSATNCTSCARHAAAEVRDVRERDHRVPVRVARQMVDEVDDAVLEPAYVEAEHDVRDERARDRDRSIIARALVSASMASMAGPASRTNARRAPLRPRRAAPCGA